MEKSESIGKLAASLAKFQAAISGIKKDGKNPHFKSEYTTLDALIEGTRKLLAENGLSVAQIPVTEGEAAGVDLILMHESGEYLTGRVLLPMGGKFTPQSAGSAITYARRYSLAGVLGLPSETDDDGNAAVGVVEQTKQTTQPEPAPSKNGKPQAEVVNLEQPGGHMTVTHKTPAAWKPDAIKWMVKEGHAKNTPHANEIWKLLKLDECTSKAEVVKRVELYRKNKDEANQTTEVAAQHAIAGNDLTA